jgi:hypothetical protein
MYNGVEVCFLGSTGQQQLQMIVKKKRPNHHLAAAMRLEIANTYHVSSVSVQ